MIESSKDLLFLILAISILALSVFICWVIYYLIVILKKINDLVEGFKEVVDGFKEKLIKLENIFNTLEEKISHSASYLPLLFKGLTELIDYIKKRKKRKSESKQK